MVGALLLAFTGITVALSYVHFGTQKANIAVAMLVATLKAGLVAAIFMHLAAEKRLIYRILVFTGLTVALSYVHFGTQKANIAVAMLVATVKAGLVAAIFMHLAAERRLIYRILIFTGFFVLGMFWLILFAWYDYPIFR